MQVLEIVQGCVDDGTNAAQILNLFPPGSN